MHALHYEMRVIFSLHATPVFDMSIVARLLPARGGLCHAVLALCLLSGSLPAHAQDEGATPTKGDKEDALAELNAKLQEIHTKAAKAREEKDFQRVELLRLERLATLRDSKADSPWTAGHKAIVEADDLIKRMKYQAACDKLKEAWEAFESPRPNERVFGDLAMKLFEATQATLAVYPDAATATGVSSKKLREAVQLAADEDPCQVEALAADAFLAVPNPDESFQPAELRPSLRLRNKRLIDISFSNDRNDPSLPWHAAAEFLKAESSSFVLDDLKYYENFLDPERRLSGRDRHGEPFNVVMGGALLIIAPDGDGPKRPCVAEYLPEQQRWQRLRPMILSVGPVAARSLGWRIDQLKLGDDIAAIVKEADGERRRLVRRQLIHTADGLKAEGTVKNHIQTLWGWMKKPPKGQATPSLDQILSEMGRGYQRYAARVPDDGDAAALAAEKLRTITENWRRYSELRSAVLGVADPAAMNADAGGNGVLDRFLAFLSSDSLTEIEAADADARAEEEASPQPPPDDENKEPAEETPAEETPAKEPEKDASKNKPKAKEKNPDKPAAKNKNKVKKQPTDEAEEPDKGDTQEEEAEKQPPQKPKKEKPVPASFLSGRQLRSQLAEQVDYFDLLMLYHQMFAVHHGAIATEVQKAEEALAKDQSGQSGTGKSASEQQRAARQRQAIGMCKRGLTACSAVFAKSQRERNIKGPNGVEQKQTYLVIALDGLRATRDALDSISQGLSQLGDDSLHAQFVENFARKCALVERPVGLESELIKSSEGDAKRVHAWSIGQTRWTIYEFPKGVSNAKLADWIDYSRRLAFDIADLDAAAKAFARQHGTRAVPPKVSLRRGATTEFTNPLVDSRNGLLQLQFLADIKYPLITLLLAIDNATENDFKPEGFAGPQGQEFLWLEDAGNRYKTIVKTAQDGAPELVIEYPGAEGHVPLAIPAERFAASRYLRDRRGNRIVRDQSSGEPANAAKFYKITSDSGTELTDRSVNYAKQDWIDLDRNIINSFLPDLMLHAPSLPAWRLYRQEFERKSPAPDWKWTVPRWAFTITGQSP